MQHLDSRTPPGGTVDRCDGSGAVDGLLGGGAVHSVFQPIVDLASGCVVAYEALTRGPHGHRWEAPDALFAAARSAGILAELDASCVQSALGTARASGLSAPWTLFVNIEPDSHVIGVLAALAPVSPLPVVVELTERALADDPADVLDTVTMIRRLGWGVALDDVGVNPDSLALLPLIAPDVIKLDASLVQQRPDRHTARVFSAVAAEEERTGCVIVAEGIETSEHLHAARAMGAHLGQGWLFGRPGTLPVVPTEPPNSPLRLRPVVPLESELTPFGVAASVREARTSSRALLLAMSKHLERQAGAIGESCLMLAAFQTAAAFEFAARRYSDLASNHAYVAVFGSGLTDHPAPGVRGVDLAPDEPLSREWNVVIVGPHFAAVLAARQVDDDPDGVWDYVLSYDRALTVRTAVTLVNRITR